MVAPSQSSPLAVAPTATRTTRASMNSVQKQPQEGDADSNLNHSDSSFTVNVQEDTDKKSTQIHKSVSFVSGNDDFAREYRVIPYWTIQDDEKLWYSADEIARMRGEHTTSLERLEESLREQEADDDDDEEPNYYESHSHAVAFQELYRANQHNSLPIDKALRAKIVNLYLESDEWVGLERVAAGLPSQQPNKIREILQACQGADQSDTNEENDAIMPLQRKCQILSRGDRSFAANSGMAIAASIMMESVGERLAKAASMSLQKKSQGKSKTPSPGGAPKNRIITSNQQEEADYISDIDDNDMDDVFDESDSENDDDDDDNNSVHSGKSLGSTRSVLSSKSLASTSSKYSMKDAIDNLLQQKQKEQSLTKTRRASLTDAAPSRRGRFKLSKDGNTNMLPSKEDNIDRQHKTNMPRRASMESSGRAMMLMKASQQGKARLDKDALKEMMMESKKERTPAPRKILVSFAETLVTQNHLISACQDEEKDAVIWYTKAELKALARDFLHAPQTLEKAGAIGKGTASTLSRVFDLSEEEKALPEKLQSRLLGYYVEYTDIVGLEYIIMGQRYVQARRLKEIMEAIHRIQDSVNGPLQHRAIVAASRKITKQARDFAVRMGMGQAAAATVVNAAGGAGVPKRGLRRSKGSSRSLGSSKSLGSSRSLKSIKSHKSSKGSRPLERSSSSKRLERSSSSKKLERSSSKRLERKTSSKKRLGRSSSREKVRSHSSSSHKSRKSRSKSHDDKEGSKKRSSSLKSRKLEKAGNKKKLVKSSSKKNLEKDSKKEVDDHSEHQPRRKLTKRNQESL